MNTIAGFDLVPLFVSFRLAAVVTLVLTIVGIPLAWLFARSRRRWMPWIESVFSVSLVLPPTVLGLYLLIFFSPNSPVGGFLESAFGLRLVFSFEGLVVASCIAGLPFMLGPLQAAMAGIPSAILEASASLGKNKLTTLFRVVLPLARTGLLAGAITVFAHTLGEFGIVMMIGGSIPGVTKVVSVAIWEHAEMHDLASAQVYAIVLLVISYVGVLSVNLLRRRGGPGLRTNDVSDKS